MVNRIGVLDDDKLLPLCYIHDVGRGVISRCGDHRGIGAERHMQNIIGALGDEELLPLCQDVGRVVI